MIKLEFNRVCKTYRSPLLLKKSLAVSDLSFEVTEGQVFGLIGPNGAGKSTSIRMMLGLMKPDSGKIFIDSIDPSVVSVKRNIGYLPENPYLYDYLTLNELLAFCGATSGMSRTEIQSNGNRLIQCLDLVAALNKPLRTFSKGMLQRAGICFALLHDPSIVVLDEPMSGLDPIGRKMVFDLVMDLKNRGKTVFFCSHILNDVERLCDSIGLLNKGCLVDMFSQDELAFSLGKKIFFLTQNISSKMQSELIKLGVQIRDEEGGLLLAFCDTCLYSVCSYLERKQIKVIGSRESWLTLEEIFMRKVAEANQ